MPNRTSISTLVVFLISFVAQPLSADDILIADRNVLTIDKLSGERISLGEADDYKPCVARLPSGELLLTAFHCCWGLTTIAGVDLTSSGVRPTVA